MAVSIAAAAASTAATVAAAAATTDCDALLKGRAAAHSGPTPHYRCEALSTSAVCERAYVPRGPCQWNAEEGCARVSRCRAQALQAPTGVSYIFFKFHKVGGSTVSSTLRTALALVTGTPTASCLEHGDVVNQTATAIARYKFCQMCSHHDQTLPLVGLFAHKKVLSASRESRLATMYEHAREGGADVAARGFDFFCNMQLSKGNRLLTGTMVRLPVNRAISKYFYLRTYCAERAAKKGVGDRPLALPPPPHPPHPCALPPEPRPTHAETRTRANTRAHWPARALSPLASPPPRAQKLCGAAELDIMSWISAEYSKEESDRLGLDHKASWKISHEVLAYLGAKEPDRVADKGALLQVPTRGLKPVP